MLLLLMVYRKETQKSIEGGQLNLIQWMPLLADCGLLPRVSNLKLKLKREHKRLSSLLAFIEARSTRETSESG